MSESQEDRPRGKNVRSSDGPSSNSSPKKKSRPAEVEAERRSTKNVVGSSQLDNLYAMSLPSSDYYERSYMHRDVLTHLLVTASDFLITGSQDGHLKFWKILTADYLKQKQTAAAAALHQTSAKSQDEKDVNANLLSSPIEFVKHFRAHLGPILSLCVNESGTLLCSACGDRTVKMFDVLPFDMITMVKLDFVPLVCSFVRSFVSSTFVDLSDLRQSIANDLSLRWQNIEHQRSDCCSFQTRSSQSRSFDRILTAIRFADFV